MKFLKWGKTERDRARQAAVQGITDYSKNKPKTKAARWGSIAGLLIGAVVFVHTGNPTLSKMAGDVAGAGIEHAIEERDESGRTE